MRRREVLALGAAVATWPHGRALAQPSATPLVGVLNSGPERLRPDQLDGLHRGLREAGFVERFNLAIAYRGAEGRYERLPALAADLARIPVSVIATAGGPVAALAAKAATSTVPIVFAAVSDPVQSGLVASLSRPGGNVTGNAGLTIDLEPKRLELLSELAPTARLIGALVNPNRPGVEGQEHEMLVAARTAGRELTVLRAGDSDAIEWAFRVLAEMNITALLVGVDAIFNDHRAQIIALAARHAVVAVYPWSEFVSGGGLVSYGPSLPEAYRLSGLYVGRILKGEKASDLPVIQPTKFDLFINQKTARALGLTIPPTLLARADEVIE
jgi:putative tryptophan/tyrosine transport system substrate-binding protein